MHFIVSWDIRVSGPKVNKINAAMKKGLSGYSWVRPLKTFYIVNVNSQDDWDSIRKSLVSTVNKYPRMVIFVMSPLMEGGKYYGILPKELWPKIRKRTE